MGYPNTRLRRLRRTPAIRRLFDAPFPGPEKFLWPVFVVPGKNRREAIEAMPGQYRLSVDQLIPEAEAAAKQGISGLLLFGVPGEETAKDACGLGACDDTGVVQDAVRALKRELPELVIFTDVCLCAYTDHGHCGPLAGGDVDNDATLPILAETALSHARAGADGVAPSAMMDGQIKVIRQALDTKGFEQTILMSYSTKFASSMYGPFREAENSAPGKGDRKGYQQSFRDLAQALRESLYDEEEGADLLMVKPALFYLDIIARLKEETLLPVASYNVSGEYSMLHASAARGWGDLREMVRESLYALERAGSDLIISYWARYYADYLH